MTYASVRFAVADYTTWRAGFDSNEPGRRAAGATGANQVYRDLEQPNTVTLILEWNGPARARQFFQDPALRQLQQKSGVIGVPETRVMNKS